MAIKFDLRSAEVRIGDVYCEKDALILDFDQSSDKIYIRVESDDPDERGVFVNAADVVEAIKALRIA